MSDISISSCASDEPPPLVEGDVDCDGEQERERIQILVDIRTRLLTGHHTNSTRYATADNQNHRKRLPSAPHARDRFISTVIKTLSFTIYVHLVQNSRYIHMCTYTDVLLSLLSINV